MVRTVDSLRASLDALAEREQAFAKVLETRGPPEPRFHRLATLDST